MTFFEEHSIVTSGIKRYYAQDFTFNNLLMKNKNPVFLCFNYHIFKDSSWNSLIVKVFNFLMLDTNTTFDQLDDFSHVFFKSDTFSLSRKKGYKLLNCGMFIKANGSADYCFDLLKRMIKFFNVDLTKSFLLLNLNSREEPSYIKDYIRDARIDEFRTLLLYKQINKERIGKIVTNLLSINRKLKSVDFRFNDLFVLTDKYDLGIVKNYVLSLYKTESKKQIERYFDYLKEYYQQLEDFYDEKNIFTSYVIDGYGNVREIDYRNVKYVFER